MVLGIGKSKPSNEKVPIITGKVGDIKNERVLTGIDDLDKALNGGIPKGNIVLLSGGCGTGKSTFCLQYLVNGAMKFKEKGLYFSTEQTKEELYKAALQYGWDLADLEKKNLLKVVYFDIIEGDNFLDRLYNVGLQFQPQRIVVDSLTTFTDSLLVSDKDNKPYKFAEIANRDIPVPTSERIVVKNALYHLLKKLRLYKATTIMTSELPEKSEFLSADGLSEFICDGVLVLHYLGIAGADTRTLQVRKMRYTDHNKSYVPYEINSLKGFEVHLDQAMDVLMK